MSAARRAVVLGVALLLGAARAHAQGLVSPGPLASPHARYDNLANCLACHDAGRELSGRKCLTCHVTLAARIRADHGYHALATKHGAELACRTCHSEHNGRPYRLVRWPGNVPKEQFDHRTTGYPLEGAHARQRCEACHRQELVVDAGARADTALSVRRTFLGLSTACGSCHLDEHRGRVSRQCQDCHDVTAWKPVPRFNHNTTRFPLTGRHADLRCNQCHEERHAVVAGPTGERDSSFVDFRAGRPGQAAGTATTCASCHASPHREAGRSGRCEPCHTTRSWFDLPDSVRRFDHTAIGFPLRGAHANAQCESCHLAAPAAPLSQRVALVRTNFVRPFAHQKMLFARCDQCHADVHQGQLAPGSAGRDCAACHTETRFSPTRFTLAMHDSTAFRLAGAHAATPCARCHPVLPGAQPGSGAVRFRQADRSCMGCHRDEHGGQFAGRLVRGARFLAGTAGPSVTLCDACHGVDAWSPATFDHDSTRYPLRGAHRRLACGRCHTRPSGTARTVPVSYSGLPTTCNGAGCHLDPHRGDAGPRCEQCHAEASWHEVGAQNAHARTRLPDLGVHAALRCEDCHRQTGAQQFTGRVTACVACHQSTFNATALPSHATLGLPVQCELCHQFTTWSFARFPQHDALFPIFSGAHAGVWRTCATCHPDATNYQVFVCTTCHAQPQTDPRHQGIPGYQWQSQACLACHPAGRHGDAWFHEAIFPIASGTHAGKWTACSDCHTDPANRATFSCMTGTCHPAATTSGVHQGIPGYAYTAAQCYSCHPTGQRGTFTQHDALFFPIYSGRHAGLWSACTQCHTDANTRATFTCMSGNCHPAAQTNSNHSGVGGYQYVASACYSCHPQGTHNVAPFRIPVTPRRPPGITPLPVARTEPLRAAVRAYVASWGSGGVAGR